MAFVYNLISCNQGDFISQFSLCSNTAYPNDGEIVFISGSPLVLYKIRLVSTPTDCTGFDPLPSLVGTGTPICGDGYEYFILTNCQTGEIKNTRFPMGDLIPYDTSINYLQADFGALQINNTCSAWSVQFSDSILPLAEEVIDFVQFEDCLTALTSLGICLYSERHEFELGYVVLPSEDLQEDRIYKGKYCCYNNLVLASSTSTEKYKNDFTGMYFQKQVSTDFCNFILEDSGGNETPLNNNDFGRFGAFGFSPNSNLTTFMIEWRKVLIAFGEGCYKLKKEVLIGGISYVEEVGTYDLREFSVYNANYTVRLDSYFSAIYEFEGVKVDFDFSLFQTSLRVRGFFGNEQPEYEIKEQVYTTGKRESITIRKDAKFTLQVNSVPQQIGDLIKDFILFSDVEINDYNENNYDYNIKGKKVSLDSQSFTYPIHSREVTMDITFKERYLNNNKFIC